VTHECDRQTDGQTFSQQMPHLTVLCGQKRLANNANSVFVSGRYDYTQVTPYLLLMSEVHL